MAVKAVCVLYYVQYDPVNSGKFRANISIAGIDPGNAVDTSVFLEDISPTISAAFLEADIKQAVKDHLTNNFGYSFGMLDSVRMVGALL